LRQRGCEHLVVCSHGPLAFLPLHLLPAGPRLLADDWCVTTIPTLGALLPSQGRRPDSTSMGLAVVASSNGGEPFGLPSEPRLSVQAEAIHHLDIPGECLADGHATPRATLDLLRRSTHAHIAAHGSSLDQIPSFHCMYLDSVDGEDGRLFAHQIMHADLRGLHLVTLCACETALGRVDTAGNVRGLPLAFLAAGAQTVVATLWPVATEPAFDFFAAMYEQIGAGHGKLRAYRNAQLTCRQLHPRFADWGAFTYIGSWI
jgi:CHAT domain-containing protein